MFCSNQSTSIEYAMRRQDHAMDDIIVDESPSPEESSTNERSRNSRRLESSKRKRSHEPEDESEEETEKETLAKQGNHSIETKCYTERTSESTVSVDSPLEMSGESETSFWQGNSPHNKSQFAKYPTYEEISSSSPDSPTTSVSTKNMELPVLVGIEPIRVSHSFINDKSIVSSPNYSCSASSSSLPRSVKLQHITGSYFEMFCSNQSTSIEYAMRRQDHAMDDIIVDESPSPEESSTNERSRNSRRLEGSKRKRSHEPEDESEEETEKETLARQGNHSIETKCYTERTSESTVSVDSPLEMSGESETSFWQGNSPDNKSQFAKYPTYEEISSSSPDSPTTSVSTKNMELPVLVGIEPIRVSHSFINDKSIVSSPNYSCSASSSSLPIAGERSPLTVKLPMKRPTILKYSCSSKSKLEIEKSTKMRNIDTFEIIEEIGEGAYGVVYKAIDTENDDLVALKKIKLKYATDGFSSRVLREIRILSQLSHKNIVNLKEVISDMRDVSDFKKAKGSFYIVMEFVEHDLKGLLESAVVNFSELHNASIMKQLLEGLNYCHRRNILHRDIKTTNILMNTRGRVKIADFGLARQVDPEDEKRPYSNNVVSYWYRPPELLLGEQIYGPAIDIWSCGCILGELFYKRPIFPGNSEVLQLIVVSRICGTPTPEVWPSVIELPFFGILKPEKIFDRILKDIFTFMPPLALELLDNMLTLDPNERITTEDAINSSWLKNINPESITLPELPKFNCHELTVRRVKKNNKGKKIRK